MQIQIVENKPIYICIVVGECVSVSAFGKTTHSSIII